LFGHLDVVGNFESNLATGPFTVASTVRSAFSGYIGSTFSFAEITTGACTELATFDWTVGGTIFSAGFAVACGRVCLAIRARSIQLPNQFGRLTGLFKIRLLNDVFQEWMERLTLGQCIRSRQQGPNLGVGGRRNGDKRDDKSGKKTKIHP
jgi:hypothetical protein